MNSEQLEGAKKLFFILLGIDAVVTAIVGFNAFSTVGVLREVQSGARTIDQSMISSLEFWDSFSKLVFLTVIGVGIGLVKWLNACYSFAKQTIGATGFKNEGWTAAGWIIPVFNLFKPYQIINEIYKAGSNGYHAPDDWKKESGSGALLTWWVFWAVTHFIGWMVTKQLMRTAFRDDISIPQAIGVTELQAWLCMGSLLISGLWVWVANLLTQRMLDRGAIPANAQSVKRDIRTSNLVPLSSQRESAVPFAREQQEVVLDEDAIYAKVANELETGVVNKGLWTRMFVECSGDENQTKLLYIKQRVAQLRGEFLSETAQREALLSDPANEARACGLSEEDIEYLREPIKAVRYLEKYRVSKDKLSKALGLGKIRGVLCDGVLWVQDRKIS